MKKSFLPLFFLVAVLGAFIIFAPRYGWQVRNFLYPRNPGAAASADPILENVRLKAELAKFKNIESQLPQRTLAYIPAIVYSDYPFNFKNELFVGAGKADGVAPGRAVMAQGILMGKIEKVFDDTSLVQTVFDENFQMPVRIGADGVEALLRGGLLPKVSLIPLKSKVAKGDAVYSVSHEFPYGSPVGLLGEPRPSADQLFLEAPLSFSYDINSITTVMISKR